MSVGTDQLQYTYRVTFTYHYSANYITSIAFNTVTPRLPWFFNCIQYSNPSPNMVFQSVVLNSHIWK